MDGAKSVTDTADFCKEVVGRRSVREKIFSKEDTNRSEMKILAGVGS
jgi:hypothetical protein